MTQLQRRRSPRYSLEAVQWIAPVKQDDPGPGDFMPVRCHDISKSGFSFWSDVPPDFEELIVRIQKGTGAVFVRAEVIHVTRHTDVDYQKFLVGCRFKKRISG
jgi:hypothetical protein